MVIVGMQNVPNVSGHFVQMHSTVDISKIPMLKYVIYIQEVLVLKINRSDKDNVPDHRLTSGGYEQTCTGIC